jgi:HD-like signal output (HDOD) protein
VRSDVYALGVIFYEMLTGEPAVTNAEEISVIQRVLSESITPPSQARPDIDSRLDDIVCRAVAKDPDARYADAGAMKAALDRIRVPAAMEGSAELHTSTSHGTVEFLLLRMKRKADFPVLSQRLSTIHHLTSDSSQASIKKLTNLVLQDFALANRLLRIANSVAFQGNGRITNVSEAIMKLGLDKVRALASSLMLATPPPGRALHPVFPEVMLGAFISAVLGRNIGHLAGLANAEEVFICSMFSRLGEILTIYYLPDEYDEVVTLMRTRMVDELGASRAALGVGFDVLGIEVARHCNFPPTLSYAMRALPKGILPEAVTQRERIAHCAGFARELCEATWRTPDSQRESVLSGLTERFDATVPRASKHLRSVIRHSLDVGQKYCHALSIDPTEAP